MNEFTTWMIALLIMSCLTFLGVLALALFQSYQRMLAEKELKDLNNQIRESRLETVQILQQQVSSLGEIMAHSQESSANAQNLRLLELNRTLEQRLFAMQIGNEKKLDEMRQTVDEKLEKTLEERLGQSFKLVSERLEQVHQGLGEMQNLAAGVGDLKKVLSNVKTRGVLGEVQLGAILEQIMSPEQYARNQATIPESSERVEYAIKLPGNGTTPIWLPIDAKFPLDPYHRLIEAYDSASPAQVEESWAILQQSLRNSAKTIREKYIEVPYTSDFAILFLPIEGLYAEVVRRGLSEELQRDQKITVAGPTTLAALLNSLQMGFRTLAIEKRSSQVWTVLGGVKSEFSKFGDVLARTQLKLTQANSDLDKLIGVRTRQIQSRLRDVTEDLSGKTNLLLTNDPPQPDTDQNDVDDETEI